MKAGLIMPLPNYKNGSIVNLMSSIALAFGHKSIYNPLKLIKESELKSKNIVLLVIDGLGYEYILKEGNNSVFNKYLRSKNTSVFPSTTASAITSFHTGLPVQQHAVPGWFTYLRELGVVAKILPFSPRMGGPAFSKLGIQPSQVLSEKSFYTKIRSPSYVIYGRNIADSDYNKVNTKGAKKLRYTNLSGLVKTIKKVILSHNRRKFIFAYWPKFDSICHEKGIKSKEAKLHYNQLSKEISKLVNSLKGTDTLLIITSDHGIIDTSNSKTIKLINHPKLMETLTLPLCGEPRVAYCYVHPSKSKQFEDYIKKRFNRYCSLHKSQDLINQNYFGLFKPNKKLLERIGDYVLIMKKNYVLFDFVVGEKRKRLIGNHGGTSTDEMYVPLIVAKR